MIIQLQKRVALWKVKLIFSFESTKFNLTNNDDNRFIKNSHHPQKLKIKRTKITFYDSTTFWHTYNLDRPDIRYFLSNTAFVDQRFFERHLLNIFIKDGGVYLNYSDKKSDRNNEKKCWKIKNMWKNMESGSLIYGEGLDSKLNSSDPNEFWIT